MSVYHTSKEIVNAISPSFNGVVVISPELWTALPELLPSGDRESFPQIVFNRTEFQMSNGFYIISVNDLQLLKTAINYEEIFPAP
jgi:hypothetical protein